MLEHNNAELKMHGFNRSILEDQWVIMEKRRVGNNDYMKKKKKERK
jgi:hypothetical protein